MQLPSLQELNNAIDRLKRSRAPGPDEITTDFLTDLDDENLQGLLDIVETRWRTGDIPEEILIAEVISLH